MKKTLRNRLYAIGAVVMLVVFLPSAMAQTFYSNVIGPLVTIHSEPIIIEDEIKKPEAPEDETPVSYDITIYAEMSIESEVLGGMASEDEYTIVEELEGWRKVAFGDITGYIVYAAEETKDDEPADETPEDETPVSYDITIYAEMSTESEVLGGMASEDEYTIVEELEGWKKITFGEITGYIVSIAEEPVAEEPAVESYINIYAEASLESEVVGKLTEEDQYTVVEELEGFLRVKFGEITGYIPFAAPEPEPEPETPVERKVTLTNNIGDEIFYGDTVIFYGHLTGYDNIVYSLQWQCDMGDGWKDIEGANDIEYSFVLDEFNFNYCYRLTVTFTE